MPTRIDDLLRMAMSFGASDLHLRAGSYPVIRVTGELKPLSGVSRLSQDETLEMAFSMMSNRQKQHFKEVYEVDIGYGVSGLGRFRVNIFQQRNSIGIVARVISDKVRLCVAWSAADSQYYCGRGSRSDSRHRNDRFRQIDYALSNRRSHKRQPQLPHRNHRRPDRISPQRQNFVCNAA